MMDWADVNDVSLRYELVEHGQATLVLLHEMGGTLETWDAVMQELTGIRILRYDMRGAGLSQKIQTLAIDDLVGDLRALLSDLGLDEPVTIAGVAVGGAVAAAFAARFPVLVRKLLLMSLASGIPPPRRESTLAIAESIRTGGLRASVESRLSNSFPIQFRTDPARLRANRGRALSNDPASYSAYYRMLVDLDLSPDLACISCPTLVLAGAADQTRTPDAVRHDATLIPGAAFEVVESGHVMPALTPSLVAAYIQRCVQ